MQGVITADGATVLTDELELDAPRTGEIVVRIERCGLCLTDLHIMEGTLDFPQPVVCGHEAAGVVEDVGSDVTSIASGQRVVLSCRPPCRTCRACLRGEPQLCARSLGWQTGGRADGSSPLHWRGVDVALGVGIGAFAQRVIVPGHAAIPIPDDLTFDLAAVLGCAVLTGAGAILHTADVRAGQSVLVIGLGGVGLSAIMAARAAGASVVIGVDPRDDRRTAATQSGADIVVDSDAVAQAVSAATEGEGVDVAVDAVADVGGTIGLGFASIRPGGHLVVAGVPPGDAEIVLPAGALVSDERHVSGCFLGSTDAARDISMLIDLWRAGRFDLDALVTSVRPLSELPGIVDGADTPPGVRTVIAVGDTDG